MPKPPKPPKPVALSRNPKHYPGFAPQRTGGTGALGVGLGVRVRVGLGLGLGSGGAAQVATSSSQVRPGIPTSLYLAIYPHISLSPYTSSSQIRPGISISADLRLPG